MPFEIDHIRPRKHRGTTVAGNLALTCAYCNGYKGPNLTDIDPLTRKITGLFHPRRHSWPFHFRYAGGKLLGRTAIDVLRINLPNLVAICEMLIEDGRFSSHSRA